MDFDKGVLDEFWLCPDAGFQIISRFDMAIYYMVLDVAVDIK